MAKIIRYTPIYYEGKDHFDTSPCVRRFCTTAADLDGMDGMVYYASLRMEKCAENGKVPS